MNREKIMDTSLRFERTMQLFFGNKAYQIAGSANNKKERKRWLLKLIKELTKIINNLDTSLEHKQLLLQSVEQLESTINKNDDPSWDTIYSLFSLCGRLLGLHRISQNPVILRSAMYWQNEDQHSTERMLNELPMESRSDIITIQSQLASQLKADNISTFKIGLILNIREYKVKRLIQLAKKQLETES